MCFEEQGLPKRLTFRFSYRWTIPRCVQTVRVMRGLLCWFNQGSDMNPLLFPTLFPWNCASVTQNFFTGANFSGNYSRITLIRPIQQFFIPTIWWYHWYLASKVLSSMNERVDNFFITLMNNSMVKWLELGHSSPLLIDVPFTITQSRVEKIVRESKGILRELLHLPNSIKRFNILFLHHCGLFWWNILRTQTVCHFFLHGTETVKYGQCSQDANNFLLYRQVQYHIRGCSRSTP
jgi:hypothetical protein